MKQIPLTQGKFALVDDEDYEMLMQRKWQAHYSPNAKTWYAVTKITISGKRKDLRMHRLLLNITESTITVDHKDHNGLNNQRLNIRKATMSDNCSNRKVKSGKVSKYLGVYPNRKRWVAAIGKSGKFFYLGIFVNEIDAAEAYNNAAIKMHGEFANLNKIAG